MAKKWDTIVLSADSRQFYKELAIGTAKPSLEEQNGIQHYFVDSHALNDEVSSARYAQEALKILEQEFKNHERILMVGGSGMFIDAVCIGLDNIPTDLRVRDELTEQWKNEGLEPLLKELKAKDSDYFEQVDKNNPPRVIRALEAIRISGITYSELRKGEPSPPPFQVIRFVIDHDREVLYNRINLRVDLMMEAGLLDEVKSVAHLKGIQTLRTVGYTELFDYLDGTIDLDRAVELIKQNTRRYAKRQLTWFRRHPEAHWIPFNDTEKMAQAIEEKLL